MSRSQQQFYPAALTVAGSDSGGGAGIQADLRTFAAFGVYGCSAITAITAQNPREVRRVDAIPAAGVVAQIKTVLDGIGIEAVKTGMLLNSEIIDAIVPLLAKSGLPLVVDPVMVATSGAALLQDDAVAAVCEKLLPLATWITPNIPEAEILTGSKIESFTDMKTAAVRCSELWDCGCLLKTGHCLQGKSADDIVAIDGKLYHLSSPVCDAPKHSAHGTGCTLSAALTAALALGFPWKKALRMAKGFVYGSLNESIPIGPGLSAMYPPADSNLNLVELKRID
jgi:hydroxymethylpyrimidine/phosphomethylpyrimidine kinase